MTLVVVWVVLAKGLDVPEPSKTVESLELPGVCPRELALPEATRDCRGHGAFLSGRCP